MDEITRTALSNYAEAAQLLYLEERCPTLTTQERGDYVRFLSTASSFLQVVALGAYQAAIANEYDIGSRLVPDRFRDCTDPAVAEAIRSGYSKARTAVMLINQIPNNYRLPTASAQQAPAVTESPQSTRSVRLVQHPADQWIWINLDSINTRAGVTYYSTAISMRGGVSPEAEGYRAGPLRETNGINCATGERISYDTMYDRWESSGAANAALRSLICGD